MKTRKLLLIGVVAAAAVFCALAAAGGCGSSTPKPTCLVARQTFFAKYTLKSSQDPNAGPCARIRGELLGLQKYGPPGATTPVLSIKTDTLGAREGPERVPADPTHANYSDGTFDAPEPNSNSICTVSNLDPAEQDRRFLTLPDGGFVTDGGVAVTSDTLADGGTAVIKYEWRNVRFLVSASHPGNQFAADLRYTEGGCTSEYDVLALAPAKSCTSDAACSPLPDPNDPPGTPGSGISPDYPVTCDRSFSPGRCVLVGTFPALK